MCVMRNEKPSYGRACSDGSWHVYALHVNPRQTTLIVDDRREVNSFYHLTKHSAYQMWVGSNSSNMFNCREYIEEIRLVEETSISRITMSVHKYLVSKFVAEEELCC